MRTGYRKPIIALYFLLPTVNEKALNASNVYNWTAC